jgi:hypothetical protein
LIDGRGGDRLRGMRAPFAVPTAVAVLASIAAARPTSAHKGHARPSPSPSAAAAVVSPPASGALPGARPSGDAGAVSTTAPSPAPPAAAAPAHVDWRAAAFEHMHNKLVHFPIALGLAAAVILLVCSRWPQFAPAAGPLLTAAALFAPPSAGCGCTPSS